MFALPALFSAALRRLDLVSLPSQIGLPDAAAYLCAKSEAVIGNGLSSDVMEKLLYLADCRYLKAHGRRLFEARWFSSGEGPRCLDLVPLLEADPRLSALTFSTFYGDTKRVYRASDPTRTRRGLASQHKAVLDAVAPLADPLAREVLRSAVFSSPAIVHANAAGELDLAVVLRAL